MDNSSHWTTRGRHASSDTRGSTIGEPMTPSSIPSRFASPRIPCRQRSRTKHLCPSMHSHMFRPAVCGTLLGGCSGSWYRASPAAASHVQSTPGASSARRCDLREPQVRAWLRLLQGGGGPLLTLIIVLLLFYVYSTCTCVLPLFYLCSTVVLLLLQRRAHIDLIFPVASPRWCISMRVPWYSCSLQVVVRHTTTDKPGAHSCREPCHFSQHLFSSVA